MAQPCREKSGAEAAAVAIAAWLVVLGAFGTEAARSSPPKFQFRTNDVIAFVGGEDVVEMQHNGYLELLLTAALPHHKLRFRNLAFEGDTVFEQHRQLNFPSWEKQLERVGATVVIAQFGQAESLQGTNGLGKFVEAYGKLLDRFTNGGRRVVLLAPTPFEKEPTSTMDLAARNSDWFQYLTAIVGMASRRSDQFVGLKPIASTTGVATRETRDGLHLNRDGHWQFAERTIGQLGIQFKMGTVEISRYAHFTAESGIPPLHTSDWAFAKNDERLRQLILEKNRLWFDYWRPQNWAFLHGDRTEQPSSRDHRDPEKRWFPEEMEKFLPLIEAKEKEIWKLAEDLAPK